MADQGLLAQSKPAANTNTILYSAPADKSASSVLTIANDGTGSAYKVGIKDYDQKLTVGSGALLHPGDIITGYTVTVNNNLPLTIGWQPGQDIVSDTQEGTLKFESFKVPDLTTFFVKDIAIRQITTESATGTAEVGQTLTTGASPNDTTATIYGVQGTLIFIGPSTINGTGAEFAAGDAVTTAGGFSATVSAGGIGTAAQEYVFSSTTAGGTYDLHNTNPLSAFSDRTYRFDLSDASMSGRLFRLSTTANGEYGPDGDAATTGDNGVEYTTGKTTNGTAGSGGAYVQYDFAANSALAGLIYFYDGNTTANAGAGYGGLDRSIAISGNYTYTQFYAYDVEGTWTNSSDSFTAGGTTYTVTAQGQNPYGYVRSYSGTDLYVIKGKGSTDFAGSDTFRDVPKNSLADRSTVTVSSVDVDTTVLEDSNYIVNGVTNGNNEVDRITSIVVGPGERLIVNSTTANNSFSLIGFEDNSTAFPTKAFAQAGI